MTPHERDTTPSTATTPPPSIWRTPWPWAVLVSMILIPATRGCFRHVPDPPPVIGQLPAFSLVDSTGRPFGNADLAGHVWIVDFVFTRCTSICPLLTRSMAQLAEVLDRNGVEDVRLLTITVDPTYDTPERLAEYARANGARPERWVFLTGDEASIQHLVVGGFKTPLGPSDEASGVLDIAHTGKLVLVDGLGRIRGYYDSTEVGLDEVYHRSQHARDEQRRQSR